MLRLTLDALQRTVVRLLLRTVPLQDDWQRFASAVPLHRFGVGARRDFRWYFEGESRVLVTSVEDVQAWLLGCTYARDPELFNQADFWQHPCTFEHLRKGDCEDFALWTWRKLIRLGYEAELVAGQSLCGTASGHAWVMFYETGEPFLFDPVVTEPHRMIRPLPEVRHLYVPEFSVDARLQRYAYAGYYRRLRGVLPRPARLDVQHVA